MRTEGGSFHKHPLTDLGRLTLGSFLPSWYQYLPTTFLSQASLQPEIESQFLSFTSAMSKKGKRPGMEVAVGGGGGGGDGGLVCWFSRVLDPRSYRLSKLWQELARYPSFHGVLSLQTSLRGHSQVRDKPAEASGQREGRRVICSSFL